MKLITILKFTTVCASIFITGTLLAQQTQLSNAQLVVANNDSTPSDTTITTNVKAKFMKEKLFGDADISAIGIKVETNNGTVHLTGTADNQQQIDNAVSLTKAVEGVTNVITDVKIK